MAISKFTIHPFRRKICLHQSTAASTWWCGPWTRLDLVEMAVGLLEGPSYSGHSPRTNHFLPCSPWTTAEGQHTASLKSVALFSCLSLARLRLLIFLLLLMSGNVHPSSGPVFPCSMCAGNVTWWGRSVQCCTCSKWIHLKYSLLSFTKFKTLDSSHSWSCPLLHPYFFWRKHSDFLLGLLQLV